MRVIAGKARRLPLKTVSGFDTRPTSDKIKETLFNILSPYIQGTYFLDLFSGSGGIGIEALSRGAVKCVFVDNDPGAVACINENLRFTKLSNDGIVLRKNVLSAISELSIRKSRFDIVYIDPPYFAGLYEETLKVLGNSGIIDKDSLVVLEADGKNKLGFLDDSVFEITRVKNYKTNMHVFLRLKENKTEA